MNTQRSARWFGWYRPAIVAAMAALVAWTASMGSWAGAASDVPDDKTIVMEFFYRGDAQRGLDALTYVRQLEQQRSGLRVRAYDVLEHPSALQRYWDLVRRYGISQAGLPAFHVPERLLIGFQDAATSGPAVDDLLTIHAYIRSGCGHCSDAKRFLARLITRWPAVRVVEHDVAREPGAAARMQELARQQQVVVTGMPGVYVCGRMIVGYQTDATTGRRIEALLEQASRAPRLDSRPEDATAARRWPPWQLVSRRVTVRTVAQRETTLASEPPLESPPDVDLPPPPAESTTVEWEPTTPAETAPEGIEVPWFGMIRVRDLGLPLFTLVIGLVDGFNPCAMWVLVFLLSVLANVRDRWKIMAIAGTFVVVSGLAYFAFMAAWLNVFLLVGFSRPLEIALGLVALLIAAVNIKDFFAFKRGLSLSIPESAKPQIYQRVRRIVTTEYLSVAVGLAVVLAVAVNTVELLCTAGLPALYCQILSAHALPGWLNYAYLALYNLAYMFDDLVMVSIFVVTLSRRKMQEGEGRWLKLISGLVLLALAMAMLFFPDMLRWG